MQRIQIIGNSVLCFIAFQIKIIHNIYLTVLCLTFIFCLYFPVLSIGLKCLN
uniref:Uncharacterized protein n=1 Tax=Anguilla anguilla TaxID=7936 RepID=A0A0E9WTK4_ANGAN